MVKHISSGSTFEAQFGYSRAVIDKDMVYLSGTTGYDYSCMEMPQSVVEQTKNTLATITKTLAEAGCEPSDILRVTYYLADRADVGRVGSLLGAYFGTIKPAATLVIADLIKPEMKIEIEVTARVGAHRSV